MTEQELNAAGLLHITAAKKNYRFPFRGNATLEDLYTLPLRDLDSIYKSLNADLKATSEDSLLEVRNPADTDLRNKIELVRFVVKSKQEEAKAKEALAAKRSQIARLKEIKANNQEQALLNKTPEEIDAMLAELGAVED
jgi:hypothetical protein